MQLRQKGARKSGVQKALADTTAEYPAVGNTGGKHTMRFNINGYMAD